MHLSLIVVLLALQCIHGADLDATKAWTEHVKDTTALDLGTKCTDKTEEDVTKCVTDNKQGDTECDLLAAWMYCLDQNSCTWAEATTYCTARTADADGCKDKGGVQCDGKKKPEKQTTTTTTTGKEWDENTLLGTAQFGLDWSACKKTGFTWMTCVSYGPNADKILKAATTATVKASVKASLKVNVKDAKKLADEAAKRAKEMEDPQCVSIENYLWCLKDGDCPDFDKFSKYCGLVKGKFTSPNPCKSSACDGVKWNAALRVHCPSFLAVILVVCLFCVKFWM